MTINYYEYENKTMHTVYSCKSDRYIFSVLYRGATVTTQGNEDQLVNHSWKTKIGREI